jgi:hypothetical protein
MGSALRIDSDDFTTADLELVPFMFVCWTVHDGGVLNRTGCVSKTVGEMRKETKFCSEDVEKMRGMEDDY